LKIAFLMPVLDRGGITTAIAAITESLAQNPDYEIEILTNTRTLPEWAGFSDSVRLVPLSKRIRIPSLPGLRVEKTRQAIQISSGLVGYLRRKKPDVVVSFQAGSVLVIAAKIARYSGKIIIRESSTPSLASRFPRPILSGVKLLLKGWANRRADTVITLTPGSAVEVIERLRVSPGNVISIPNPINADRIGKRAAQTPEIPIPDMEEIPIIVWVGRFSPEKDATSAIRAFSLVLEQRQARLLLIGDGNQRQELVSLVNELGISEQVTFINWTENAHAYMASSTVFVNTSKFEGLGNALIEAQACGIPVVSTDAPYGPRMILDDGNAGTLVSVGSAAEIAVAILTYIENPELRRAHVAKATELLARFAPEKIANQYEEIMRPHQD
jgi:glycosyltransferase involved in cell wall biosynthesis